MNNELIATILEALAKYKEDIDDINSSIELLTDETKANQDEIVNVGSGNVTHNHFTKLGSDAPAIKMKKLTGTTPSSTGLQTLLTSAQIGIDLQKILSYEVLIEPTPYTNHWFKEGSTSATELFTTYVDPNRIAINISGSNMTSANYKLFVTYEE